MATKRKWSAVKTAALSFPGTWEDSPWGEGDNVVKVGKKIFVFLGSEKSASGMSVKLTESHAHASALPGASPSGYGMGRAGWVDVPLSEADVDLLVDWVEESYRNVATKTLIKQLDAER